MGDDKMQGCHRYALRQGFIGPLTRKQTKRREYNRSKPRKPKYEGCQTANEDSDSGNYFDNFVDGRGW